MPVAAAAPLDQLLDSSAWATYRRTSTKLPRRSLSLPFCSPDSPAAVEYLDMPPAIARPSLLRSEIAVGILHRELTLLAHSCLGSDPGRCPQIRNPENLSDGEDHRFYGPRGNVTMSRTLYSHATGQWPISRTVPLPGIVPRVASEATKAPF